MGCSPGGDFLGFTWSLGAGISLQPGKLKVQLQTQPNFLCQLHFSQLLHVHLACPCRMLSSLSVPVPGHVPLPSSLEQEPLNPSHKAPWSPLHCPGPAVPDPHPQSPSLVQVLKPSKLQTLGVSAGASLDISVLTLQLTRVKEQVVSCTHILGAETSGTSGLQGRGCGRCTQGTAGGVRQSGDPCARQGKGHSWSCQPHPALLIPEQRGSCALRADMEGWMCPGAQGGPQDGNNHSSYFYYCLFFKCFN